MERATQAKPYLGVAVDGEDVLGVAVLGDAVRPYHESTRIRMNPNSLKDS